MAATVGWDAVVAGQCLRADQVEYAQFVGELPYFAFIAVHQRCMDDELFIHRQVQRHIERADEGVAAIGISAEIGLRYAGDEMENPFAPCHDGGECQEYHVPSRYEGVRCSMMQR